MRLTYLPIVLMLAASAALPMAAATKIKTAASYDLNRHQSNLYATFLEHQQERQRTLIEKKEQARTANNQQQRQSQAQSGCSLCADGSTVPNPDTASSTLSGWTCGQLELDIQSSLAPRDVECLENQVVGFTDCGCPTSPLVASCALCAFEDGSVGKIPDTNYDLRISGTRYTCEDILFVERANTAFSCIQQQQFREFCGCPEAPQPQTPPPFSIPTTPSPVSRPTTSPPVSTPTMPPPVSRPTQEPSREPTGDIHEFVCLLCPDGRSPEFSDRVIPYLSEYTLTTQSNSIPLYDPGMPRGITCGTLAQEALGATIEECFGLIVPGVAVDIQSFCGCNNGLTWDSCSLCPGGAFVQNPFLTIPSTGGMTCLELEEYLRYITDADSCNAIAEEFQEACCTLPPACNVCGNPAFVDYAREKPYPPFGLDCATLGLAEALGFELTCEDIQARFGYYCECPNAIRPTCTICALNELPPDPDLPIPLLGEGVTCGEINDYASLRTEETCVREIVNLPVDVSAYCGCTGFQPRGTCSLECPEGFVVDRNAALAENGVLRDSNLASRTCGDLVDFVPFVNSASLCEAIQDASDPCCIDSTENNNDDGVGLVGGRDAPFIANTESFPSSPSPHNGPSFSTGWTTAPGSSPEYSSTTSTSSSGGSLPTNIGEDSSSATSLWIRSFFSWCAASVLSTLVAHYCSWQ